MKTRKRTAILLILICLLLVACNFPIKDLSFITHAYPTLDQSIFNSQRTSIPPVAVGTATIPEILQPTPVVDEDHYQVYPAQSGDTLVVVARHFGVSPLDITSSQAIPATGIILPGQNLVIPRTPTNQVQNEILLPDSAVINSPCAQGFEISTFLADSNGYLRTFSQEVSGVRTSGADVVQLVAENQSVNPRLLLAFIEYRSGLVFGTDEPGDIDHPLRMDDPYFKGMYQELSLVARRINTGYYAWREGQINELTFSDDQTVPIAPNLNAGSVGLQYLFSSLYPPFEWENRLYGADGFMSLYLSMFGDPRLCAAQVEPLLTDTVTAPTLELPFASGEVWVLTAGLHYDWVEGTPFGALDFAPKAVDAGCTTSSQWARASAAGIVTYSDNGIVMLALTDASGKPTGWQILYLHIAAQGRVPLGTQLALNDPIGHPSCEGGNASGTHVHITRLYKGEWISGSGPFPLVLSGWTALPGDALYSGTLVKGDQVVTARQGGKPESVIIR